MSPIGALADLRTTLSPEDIKSLDGYKFSKEIVESPYGKFLMITYDYGSGLELTNAYIYILKNDATWSLIAYINAGNSRLDGRINKDMIYFIEKSGNNLISILLNFETMRSIKDSAAVNSLLPSIIVAPEGLKAHENYVLTKEIIESVHGKFLIITRHRNIDSADGEVYIYTTLDDFKWGLLAYVRSNSRKLLVSIKKDTLVIVKESGEIAAFIRLGDRVFRHNKSAW